MPQTRYARDLALNVRRGANVTAPSTVYVGLLSTAPTADDNPGVELTVANGYARVACTFGAPTGGGASAPREIANTAAVNFGPNSHPTTSWATAVAFGLFDAATGGNMLDWNPLLLPDGTTVTTKTVAAGDTASFAIGLLKVKMS